ncbi:rho guanine nucleotide exchange factor 10-like protein [Trichonephila inaurata madagascariensis]|uniref:Rho guanine nucleotide exchange factor 10-like protein n=1 Tax=Trichonephila inaurata madagascariensis TaxID=2747483 RepID=A0A8X6YYC6_9ARAC|nr:rho guanine nucleotide exchange factor 10-like protein [Trichonephila inaurata madagascariensis]
METLKFPAVGTCIKTRKDVPNFATKLSKRDETEFLVTKNGTMCARWLDSKEVMMLKALMSSGKLNAQYQHRRGTGCPSKTSRSLLNVGDHLPVTTKTRRRCRKCAQQKKESRTKIMCTMYNVPLCIDCFKPYHS